MLFDSHAHYEDTRFDEDRNEVLKKAYESGVKYIIDASSDVHSAKDIISLTRKFDFVYAAIGVHPQNVDSANDRTISELMEISADKKVVAIGEIGLDYYYDNSPATIELQKLWFVKLINLAKDLKLPIVVHDRDAHNDVLNIIKSEKASAVGGIFHSFSGSVEMADEVLKQNFSISIGGPLTFKNSRKSVEVVRHIPLDKLLIETDSPYLTPEPFRGKRNDSSNVRYVAEKIAEIKNVSFEEVARITTENAKKLFKIV